MGTPASETRARVAFPSEAFFQALAERMNGDEPKYKKVGWVDLRLAVRVLPDDAFREEKVYGLVFDTYSCEEARQIGAPEEIEAECVVEGPYWAWKEMFQNISENGKADTKHTFNYLTLTEWPLKLTGEDQLGIDKVFRFNFSLQLFWEEAAELEISYVT
jgi:hypothetical protein